MSFFRDFFLAIAFITFLPHSSYAEKKDVNPQTKTAVKKDIKPQSKPAQKKDVKQKAKPVSKTVVKKKGKQPSVTQKSPAAPPKKNVSLQPPSSLLKESRPPKTATPNAVPVIPKPSLPQGATSPVKPKTSLQGVKKKPLVESKLVVLDPGHGGYDVGARMSACDEKSLALSTALLAKKHLIDMGYRVILTRSRDVFMPLEKRASIANETKSKLFVSIHFNAAKSLTAKGIEVFYCVSQDKTRGSSSKKLATNVLNKIIDKTSAENRGVKEGNFFVIRETQMPAILVEAGFMTHLEELHLLKDVHYRDKIAKGIAEGVDLFFKS